MNKPELTKEENEIFMRIVKNGTMDDMFILAYAIGRERAAKEQMEILDNLQMNMKNKK